MLLYPFPALLTPFPRTFIVKGNANNGIIPSSCPFLVLVAHFPVIAFINEEAKGAINEAATGAIIAPINSPSGFFSLCFTVSVASSIHRPDSSSDSTILKISSTSSFEMNKVNLFPALTAPAPFTFLLNFF